MPETDTWLCGCGATNDGRRCRTCKKRRDVMYRCTHPGPCREWKHDDEHGGFTSYTLPN